MDLAPLIEHTYLQADTTTKHIEILCEDCIENGFGAACIPPYFVPQAVQLLSEHPTKVVTVVGFPMGYAATAAKAQEIARAFDEGADEVDVVINLSALKSENWAFVKNDIDSVTRAVHMKGKPLKVIIEMALLDPAELVKICEICTEIGVDYVKTSTGHNHKEVTTVEMIQKLRDLLPREIKIKASGGIRTREQAEQLINAGADRIGTSRAIQLVRD